MSLSTPESSAEIKGRLKLYITTPVGLRGLLYGDLYLYALTEQCQSLSDCVLIHWVV
jgi:hypothetical protein